MALFYEEWHPAARETILWLHGGGMSGWMWRPQIDRMPEYHHLVPDLPEHGKSQRERPFSIQKSAEQLARLIEQHAHYSRAHVVGISLGAQVACELIARFPDRVGRAVLSGTLVRPSPGATGPLSRSLAELTLRAYMPLRNARFLVEASMRSNRIPERFRAEVVADTRRLTMGTFRRAVQQRNLGFRLPDGLAQVAVPTLVVAGELERPVIRQSAQDLVGALPHAQGAIAQGLGHSWNLEDPDRFAAMVRAWLTDQPLPEGLVPLHP
ncbi:MAG TPA: alpha/beta hydrolase [Stenomitos sp.]